MKFKKKPEIVEAIQWDGTKECEQAIKQIAPAGVFANWQKASPPVMVMTRSGQKRGEVGGWVVKDPLGGLEYMTHEAMLVMYAPAGEAVESSGLTAETLEAMIRRIIDAKLAEQGDPIPDSPLDLPGDSFSQKESVKL